MCYKTALVVVLRDASQPEGILYLWRCCRFVYWDNNRLCKTSFGRQVQFSWKKDLCTWLVTHLKLQNLRRINVSCSFLFFVWKTHSGKRLRAWIEFSSSMWSFSSANHQLMVIKIILESLVFVFSGWERKMV